MRDINFYPGIYKIIAIVICLMLFITLNRAKASTTNASSTNNHSLKISLLTHK